MEGFNPDRAKILIEGIELTLGSRVRTVAVLDRDFRSMAECDSVSLEARSFNDWARVHARKELENFLLIPGALDRAIERRVADREKRSAIGVPRHSQR